MKSIFILIFYIFCLNGLAQSLFLNLKSNNVKENSILDSLNYQKKHNNLKSIYSEIENTKEKLFRIGFLNLESFEIIKLNDSTFQSEFNLQKNTSFIHINIGENYILINKNKPLEIVKISELENYLNEALFVLEKKGYSLAKLKLINFRKINNNLCTDLKIDFENKRKINEIVINGYEKFPKGHLKNLKRLYRNTVFNQDNLKKLNSDFEKYRFVNQIKYPEILFSTDSTQVYVYLEKAKPNTFDGFIGFTNDDEKKVVINGYLDLQLQNILNGGEKFTIFWKSDGKNQKTFNGALELPYLFKSPVGLKANLQIFKQDSIFQNTQTAIDLGYYFNYNTKVFLGIQNSESSDIQNTNSISLSDFKNNFITSHFDYTFFNANDFLFADKAQVFFKIGSGKRTNSIGNTNQYFTQLNAFYNLYLNKKNIFNIKIQNYYLKSNSYLTNELHRFGGINSIRGFNENSLQGNFLASILTEYRYVLADGIYAHSIVDYGFFQDKTLNIQNNLVGLGFGFGLLTKNGLFNFIYANGSTKNQQIKLANSIVHVSFKARF